MTKSSVNKALETLSEQIRLLEGERHSLSKALEQAAQQLQAFLVVRGVLEQSASNLPSGYNEDELARLDIEGALYAIAVADEHGVIDTSDVVPILEKAKQLPHGHENSARRISGILGASDRFERVGPGKFRLVAQSMPHSNQGQIGTMPTADDFDDDIPF